MRYEDTVKAPGGTVRRIYEYFGHTCSPDTEKSIKDWLRENPQHKHGVHKYTLDQFGLDRETVAKQFADHTGAFLGGNKRTSS